MKHDYEEAECYFSKWYCVDHKIPNNISLYIKSLEKLNRIEDVVKNVESLDVRNADNDMAEKIIKYYQMKYLVKDDNKNRIIKLEDFICENLMDVVTVGGQLQQQVFKEDLMQYVAKTTNYKKLYVFENALISN